LCAFAINYDGVDTLSFAPSPLSPLVIISGSATGLVRSKSVMRKWVEVFERKNFYEMKTFLTKFLFTADIGSKSIQQTLHRNIRRGKQFNE